MGTENIDVGKLIKNDNYYGPIMYCILSSGEVVLTRLAMTEISGMIIMIDPLEVIIYPDGAVRAAPYHTQLLDRRTIPISAVGIMIAVIPSEELEGMYLDHVAEVEQQIDPTGEKLYNPVHPAESTGAEMTAEELTDALDQMDELFGGVEDTTGDSGNIVPMSKKLH